MEGPHFIAANQQYWYVSLIGAGEVWKFDARADTLVKIGAVQGSPALLALTPDGSKLYVSQFTSSRTNKVSVVNTATMTTQKLIDVWTMPHGIRMNHAGTRLYVANMLSDNLSVIDVTTDSVMKTIMLADDANPYGPTKYMPMELAVSPDDRYVVVACSETKEVRMFNTTNDSLETIYPVGDQPWQLQFTPDGDYCYVTNRRGNSVSMLHIPMRHVMETFSTPTAPKYLDNPHGCDVSRDGRYIFVSNENAFHNYVPRYSTDYIGNVCVIDKSLSQIGNSPIVKVLEVGKMPTGLGVLQ